MNAFKYHSPLKVPLQGCMRQHQARGPGYGRDHLLGIVPVHTRLIENMHTSPPSSRSSELFGTERDLPSSSPTVLER